MKTWKLNAKGQDYEIKRINGDDREILLTGFHGNTPFEVKDRVFFPVTKGTANLYTVIRVSRAATMPEAPNYVEAHIKRIDIGQTDRWEE